MSKYLVYATKNDALVIQPSNLVERQNGELNFFFSTDIPEKIKFVSSKSDANLFNSFEDADNFAEEVEKIYNLEKDSLQIIRNI